MLSVVDPRLQKYTQIEERILRLRNRLDELAPDSSVLKQKDWQALADLTEKLEKIDASQGKDTQKAAGFGE